MRIAVGGIHTECSTYSQLIQTEADFRVREGRDLLGDLGLSVPAKITLVPLFQARSVPGGPVSEPTFRAYKDRFMSGLRACGAFDGILLVMHGAMHVDGLDDPEGDWISAVRDVVGPDVPIAVSYDLHGNVTQRVIDAIDIFAAYRTAPHIDVKETHQRALDMLVEMAAGSAAFRVGWVPVPVLWPGERTATTDEPAMSLYAALPAYNARTGVADANLMVGYVWADCLRATAAAVVTGTDEHAIAQAAEEIGQGYWEARAEFAFGMRAEPLATCLDLVAAHEAGPMILADSGDNPTGGGVGDRADVLAGFAARGLTGALFAGIADAPAALAAAAAGQGARLTLTIGGSLGSACPVVTRDAVVMRIIGGAQAGDLEVMVEIAGNRVILSQRRRPYHDIADFERFGIDPAQERVLVVKSGYLSPQLAPLASPSLMALTDGAVNQDIARLENRHRPRPTYPFQRDFGWEPVCRFGKRKPPQR